MTTRSYARLRRLFEGAAALSALSAAGCKGSLSHEFAESVCSQSTYRPLEGVTPGKPVDFIELRGLASTALHARLRVSSRATARPANAQNAAACIQALNAVAPTTGWDAYRGGSGDVYERRYIVYTRGDEVGTVETLDALAAFVAPVENPKDAAFLVSQNGYSIDCESNNVTRSGSGFEVRAQSGIACGAGTHRDEHSIHVSEGGAITVDETVRLEDGSPNCAVGRRPEGFAARAIDGATPLGGTSPRLPSSRPRGLRLHAPRSGAPRARRAGGRSTRRTARRATRYGTRASPRRSRDGSGVTRTSPRRPRCRCAGSSRSRSRTRRKVGARRRARSRRRSKRRARRTRRRRAMRMIAVRRHVVTPRWPWDVTDGSTRSSIRRSARRSIARDARPWRGSSGRLASKPNADVARLAGVPRADEALRLFGEVRARELGLPSLYAEHKRRPGRLRRGDELVAYDRDRVVGVMLTGPTPIGVAPRAAIFAREASSIRSDRRRRRLWIAGVDCRAPEILAPGLRRMYGAPGARSASTASMPPRAIAIPGRTVTKALPSPSPALCASVLHTKRTRLRSSGRTKRAALPSTRNTRAPAVRP